MAQTNPRSDRRLSKAQLKEAHDIAVTKGLDPAGFRPVELRGAHNDLVTELQHEQTRSFFRFDWFSYGTINSYSLHWWPSADGTSPTASANGWHMALHSFRQWLDSVKTEIATPDVWAIARQQRAWLGSTEAAFQGNAPFSDIEREVIARHLKTIEEHAIKSFRLQEADAAFVREELRYLREAADRMGRVDWKNIAFSVVVNLATGLALEPQKAQAFVSFVSQLLGPLVSGVAQIVSSAFST